VSISGATRLSSVSLSLTYNPSMLRVRTVQEGNLLRQGGIQATFTQKVDEAAGRVDIAVVRPGDVLGVSGTGVVAALLVEAIGPGTSPLAITGVGSLAGGGAAPLQFQSLTVTVK
jgi:general secretion pathway protein D